MPLKYFSQWTVQAEYQKSYYFLKLCSKAFFKVRDVSSFHDYYYYNLLMSLALISFSQAADTSMHPSALGPQVLSPRTATWAPLWCRRPDQPRNRNTSQDTCAEKPTQMVSPLRPWKHLWISHIYPALRD